MAQRTTDKAAPKATTAKDAAKKSAKKTTPSPCKGLAEAQCKANTACTYVGASVRKATGKKIAAYCRLKGGKKK
jgi:hypothetical protein